MTPCITSLFTFDNEKNDKQSDADSLEKLDKQRIMIDTNSISNLPIFVETSTPPANMPSLYIRHVKKGIQNFLYFYPVP